MKSTPVADHCRIHFNRILLSAPSVREYSFALKNIAAVEYWRICYKRTLLLSAIENIACSPLRNLGVTDSWGIPEYFTLLQLRPL
jgi:hypothetical protein